MRNLISRTALAAGALALGIAQAGAITIADQKQLNVQVTVAATCSITSMGNITFAPILGTFVTEAANSTLKVTCPTQNYKVIADAGQNASTPTDVTTRRVKDSAGDYLSYDLYTVGTTEWGDGTGGTGDFSASPGVPAGETYTILGSLPGVANPNPGNYSDIVLVTLEY